MEMESFGKYLLLERLASGGMAEVYLAKLIGANGINKFVAIKRILPQYSDNSDFVDMFKEEAKIAVNLNHSNIVSIYDFGVEKSQFYLVMEFVEGQNMRQVLNHLKKENKDFSIDQIVYMIKEVAAGLDHAHRCLDGTTGRPLNITHRDMSPQNVMISFEGEVKVVDFGIAKAETQMEHTRAGTIKGKFGYMSPEQAEGHPVDPRTDVFSLGIVLWELLAKDRLFTGQNEAATLRKVRECQVPSLRKINPNIPPELERICMKALAKDKSLRYQTAAAFHKDLNRFLNTQFPEFSTQEFSKFMKSLYHKMYLENRKKLADYAKVTSASSEDRTAMTSTATLTASVTSNLPPPPSAPPAPPTLGAAGPEADVEEKKLDLDVHSKRIDLSALKAGEMAGTATGPKTRVTTNTSTNTNVRVSQPPVRPSPAMNGGTQTGIRVGTQSSIYTTNARPAENNSWMYAIVALFLCVGGGFYYWKTTKVKAPVAVQAPTETQAESKPTLAGQQDIASRQSVPINIQSRPQGAIVYINGRQVGITPYIGHIESNAEFRLTIRKEGFLTYDRPNERAGLEIYRLEATLQPEPPMGFISIEVIGGGADPVVTVNGQRLDDKSQLTRYPVPAGVPVKVHALNPFARVAAEETVTVGQNQKKAVRLILSRQGNESQ
jgi:serine/threonine-protein kinase